jgi:hypothetical protein
MQRQTLDTKTWAKADQQTMLIRFFSILGRVMGLSTTASPRKTQLPNRYFGLDESRKNGPMANRKTISDASK